MATFTSPPDFGYSIEKEPRVLRSAFGDGYEQRLADGINTAPRSFSLSFASRTQSERDTIIAFIEARYTSTGVVESFDWTPPVGSAGKFVCRKWTESQRYYGIYDIAATFEEVFEP